jgi:ketosteroid isomerase-like protein
MVRALLAGFQEREYDAAFEVLDPQIVWDATHIGIVDLADVYYGHEGVRTYWRRWLSAWDDLRFEVEDVIDAGDDAVALIRNQTQRGRGSGVEVPIDNYAIVFTFRGGKVIRWAAYLDRGEALRAAGVDR